jgi:predicted ATPase/transcriptional regulator with XRE-family HTH domain
MIETYSLGDWISQRRKTLDLTQRDLAERMSCTLSTIKKLETDVRRPSRDLAHLLADALHVPPKWRTTFVECARGLRPVNALSPMEADGERGAVPAVRVAPPLLTQVTPFIGREAELVRIETSLGDPACRLLTLVGPGGIGKTRLALAAVQAQETMFIDGAAFVSLANTTDAALIPDAVARSLRLTLNGPSAEQVLVYLHRRRLLLILDNCEQLEGDLTWLSELMAHASGVTLLATSRERLHLAEEWVYHVPELAEAADLFVETAQRVKQDFNPEEERSAILRICQLVENLPLAVELAASWTPLISCAQIADHIQRDIHILVTDVRNVPERHRSIQAVFDHSWKMLSATEQNTLMRLSVCRGGWQAEEALAVVNADLFLLRRLMDKSLVRVGENGRYDLHELIRQYASKKLHEAGLETETHQRHFEAYLALAAQLDVQQFRPDGMKAVARFDQEQDNIRAALTWSVESEQTELSLRLLYHLCFYWFRRGLYREGGEWIGHAIQQVEGLESVPLCVALSFGGGFIYYQGRYHETASLVLCALTMARRLADPEALIWALLGYHMFASVNAEQAVSGLHEAIALIQETGKLQHLLPVFYGAAAIWLDSNGRYAEARDHYQKGLALYEQMGAVDLMVDYLGRLGQLALQEGRLQEAYDLMVESMAHARASGYNVAHGGWGSIGLGRIQLYLGELEAAERNIKEGLLSYEASRHNMHVQQETLAILSEVALARKNVDTAADHLQASLNICRTLYHQLESSLKLAGMSAALPINLISLCARAALVAAAQGRDEHAVTLGSIAESLHSQSGKVMILPLHTKLDKSMAGLRARLPEERFDTAWETGQKLLLSEVFEFLLA